MEARPRTNTVMVDRDTLKATACRIGATLGKGNPLCGITTVARAVQKEFPAVPWPAVYDATVAAWNDLQRERSPRRATAALSPSDRLDSAAKCHVSMHGGSYGDALRHVQLAHPDLAREVAENLRRKIRWG